LASTSAAWKRIRGVVGQAGDPLGPKHRRELAKHAWQTPGRHDRHPAHDDLAPEDQGALDSHDWDDGRAGSGRTWAAWSASNDTARNAGASG
jgi:hypothetical protein